MPEGVQPPSNLEPIGQVMPVGILPSDELEPVGEPLGDAVPPTNVFPVPLATDDEEDEEEAVPASIVANEKGATIVQQVPTFGSHDDEVVQDDTLIPDVEAVIEEPAEEAEVVEEPVEEEEEE